MSVIVRFAPSPTGYLHIGGARTALFNWLFARSLGGQFLLRIEDTDRARSTDDAIEKIFDGLRWLGLDWDGEPVFQFARAARHAEIAQKLLSEGKAYHCWSTPEELEAMRAKARSEGRQPRYDGTWRDRDPALAPAGVKPVVRLKVAQTGETTIQDMVQGEVTVPNVQLDDMVLLRGDGTPTYMLSVVVDDADMGITHVIRGDDHLTNTFRQVQLYRAMGVEPPVFAHIPLIHGPDGAKLSKRHGALGIEAYRDLGILPEAMRNYLMRLGWSHGDADVISTEQAVEWFKMDQVGRSAARFDMQKLTSLNAHWLRERTEEELITLIEPLLEKDGFLMDQVGVQRLTAGMAGLKARCRTLVELAEAAAFYVEPRPIRVAKDAVKLLDPQARERLGAICPPLAGLAAWDEASLEAACRAFAAGAGVGFGKLAQPLRVALTGSTVSPGLFEVMAVLGKEEVLARLADVAESRNPEKNARQ